MSATAATMRSAASSRSIEGRVPFLDHVVGEYLSKTPVSLKIRAQT